MDFSSFLDYFIKLKVKYMTQIIHNWVKSWFSLKITQKFPIVQKYLAQ